MPRTIFSTTDLNQLRHQLDTWRQSQAGVSRLTEALWTAATMLATTQGVGPVARTLRLDYSKLKRQVPLVSGRSAPPHPQPSWNSQCRNRSSVSPPCVASHCWIRPVER